jgi:para-aminobenzoate synthetase/4-amino-4-deoxychorismate lyase
MSQEAAPTERPRPDPRRGVFETLLVVDGHPIELDAHLARLGASVAALYRRQLPETVRPLVLRESHAGALGRLRVTVEPGDGDQLDAYALAVAVNPDDVFPSHSRGAALRTLLVDRGLGAHKWADRAALERAEAIGPPGTVPLLVRESGAVLEASRANVFAVRDEALLTPPLAGDILPGIARACLVDVAAENGIEVRERELPLAELTGADEAFLTGSVRGVEPVVSLDGVAAAGPGPISRLLARDLRRRWLGA